MYSFKGAISDRFSFNIYIAIVTSICKKGQLLIMTFFVHLFEWVLLMFNVAHRFVRYFMIANDFRSERMGISVPKKRQNTSVLSIPSETNIFRDSEKIL